VFVIIVHDYPIDCLGIDFDLFIDDFDNINLLVDYGVFMALAVPAIHLASRLDTKLYGED